MIAILTQDSNDTTVSTQQDEKLDLVVKELAELKCMITTSENESKPQKKEFKDTIIKQSEIIVQHQFFLEQLDRQKRETNIVLFGIPDGAESFDGATTDDDKIQKVWTAVDANPATVVVRSHRRLGRVIKL